MSSLADLRELVAELYCAPLTRDRLLHLTHRIVGLVDADYFGMHMSSSSVRCISNSPGDYIQSVYMPVASIDFMRQFVVTTKREYVWSRDPVNRQMGTDRDFIEACIRARPISDVVYFPLTYQTTIAGYFAISRADRSRPRFTSEELDTMCLFAGFLSHAFEKAHRPPPAADDQACLNARGEILQEGARFREVRQVLFREKLWNRLVAACRLFIAQPLRHGSDRIVIPFGSEAFAFRFSRPYRSDQSLLSDEVAFATISLLDPARPLPVAIDQTQLAARYHLTPRECEVVVGLVRGESNKEIAADLGVEETTVKRHTHNIYEKTGYSSRVDLVLGIVLR